MPISNEEEMYHINKEEFEAWLSMWGTRYLDVAKDVRTWMAGNTRTQPDTRQILTRIRKEGADAEREKVLDELIEWLSDENKFCNVDVPYCISFTSGISDRDILIRKLQSLRAQSPKKESDQ